MGDLIGMGSLDHKNFGVLHPQFWRAKPLLTVTVTDGWTDDNLITRSA